VWEAGYSPFDNAFCFLHKDTQKNRACPQVCTFVGKCPDKNLLTGIIIEISFVNQRSQDPMSILGIPLWTVILLVLSNVMMTFAWYGHLKFPKWPLITAVLFSWGIALFEYCFQVPANRIGYGTLSPSQLKILQECITLLVFGVFTTYYFRETLSWNHYVAFGLLVGAAFFAFHRF
jgi:uncharacterized protein